MDVRQAPGEGPIPLAGTGEWAGQSGAQPRGTGVAFGRHRPGGRQAPGVVSESRWRGVGTGSLGTQKQSPSPATRTLLRLGLFVLHAVATDESALFSCRLLPI